MPEAGPGSAGGLAPAPGAGQRGLSHLHQVSLTVNERSYTRRVEPRLLLSDFLRHDLGLTGTHVGCEHGVCGACTVLVDGQAVRSCLMFAVQADGARITTVEGLAPSPDTLHPVQQAFWETHGLQCGFCTPGFLISAIALLEEKPRPTDQEIREGLSGNLCRCTGYQNIVKAVRLAADRLAAGATGPTLAGDTAGQASGPRAVVQDVAPGAGAPEQST